MNARRARVLFSAPEPRYPASVAIRLVILVSLLLSGACNSTTAKGAQAAAAAQAVSTATELGLSDVPKADPREPRLAVGLVTYPCNSPLRSWQRDAMAHSLTATGWYLR